MRNITKEKLIELGFEYNSYIATCQYWESASKLWVYRNYIYKIEFVAFDVDKWNLRIINNMHIPEKCRKETQITIIPLTTIDEIKEAYEFITHTKL